MEKIIFEGKVAYRINEDIIAVDSYNGIILYKKTTCYARGKKKAIAMYEKPPMI